MIPIWSLFFNMVTFKKSKEILNFIFKEEIKKVSRGIVTDIITGNAYTLEEDTFHLNLFADAVVYDKSGNKSNWCLYSSTVELPPALRKSTENMVFHSSWTGSNPDFNNWFENYNKQIDEILNKGININSINYKFKIHIFIG